MREWLASNPGLQKALHDPGLPPCPHASEHSQPLSLQLPPSASAPSCRTCSALAKRPCSPHFTSEVQLLQVSATAPHLRNVWFGKCALLIIQLYCRTLDRNIIAPHICFITRPAKLVTYQNHAHAASSWQDRFLSQTSNNCRRLFDMQGLSLFFFSYLYSKSKYKITLRK